MSKFLSTLQVEFIPDNEAGQWRLLAPLSYQSDVVKSPIVVPVGFVTDFCSVPRIPLAFEMLGDRAQPAGAVHDWLYTAKPYEREVADKMLREMVQLFGVSKIEAELMFMAVRAGGGSHWE